MEDKHMNISKEQTFLTKKETCAILRISEPTLNRRITDGTIYAKKLGSLVRIPASELEKLASVQR
jgi:excisionase family DNA binding protein